MRIIYFLVFSLICISCSKTEDENTEFVGVWIWEESSGGIDGKTITPESSGINREVYITHDSLQLIVNGNLEFETGYYIENRESIIFNEVKK